MATEAMQDWQMVEMRGDYQIYLRQDEIGWTYSLVWAPGPDALSSRPGEQAAGPFLSAKEAQEAARAEIARRNRS
jgi:hypothetical protein